MTVRLLDCCFCFTAILLHLLTALFQILFDYSLQMNILAPL
jgi:hypothetical protein